MRGPRGPGGTGGESEAPPWTGLASPWLWPPFPGAGKGREGRGGVSSGAAGCLLPPARHWCRSWKPRLLRGGVRSLRAPRCTSAQWLSGTSLRGARSQDLPGPPPPTCFCAVSVKAQQALEAPGGVRVLGPPRSSYIADGTRGLKPQIVAPRWGLEVKSGCWRGRSPSKGSRGGAM